MIENQHKKRNAFTDNLLVNAIGTQKIVVVLVLIALILFFSAVSPAFRQYATVLSVMDYTYYLAFMGIGVTFCLITGGVDLSIGTGMICYGLIGGYMITHLNMPVIAGILSTLAAGVIMGVLNGLIVAKFELPPFLATLCTMMIARGLGSIVTGGMSITWPQASQAQGWTRSLFKITVGNIQLPIGFIWVLLFALIMSIVLNKTRPGRYIIAIGSNKEAARLSGIPVVKYQMTAYIFSGFFTGMAALAYSSTFQALAPGTGAGIELNAIGGAIIGGTSMSGGLGSAAGTILGIFIMSVLNTGLPYIGLQANTQQIIIGIVLVAAVFIDVWKNKRLA
ncbi:ABC transporter permease [Eubacterium sp. am_0171]|uniref:ABC transporter permease n=1 Tax=unclassified Eubacterium (in: firmicutes) TaxID=2624479 RepID=UPI001021B56F|nr:MULTISPECIES: ABC transporter permease [unclassified Eubacterium (in: firmicutes)]MBS6762770.1 ABC transporter permease [Clostridium sp.]MDU7706190.1 ABC transporter permease [Clostridium sp.]MSC83368.1 ABC transporter permease [Eubacterium sp. BIOML-A1]MSD05294.1 ABC transporter permease [Eubacterium sp. BIOML-A2]RYT24951.1 ABC transporter permease [Eubacterium sp. am_0171]